MIMEICAETATHGRGKYESLLNSLEGDTSVIMEICARGRATGSDSSGSGEKSGTRYYHSGVVRVRDEAGIFSG